MVLGIFDGDKPKYVQLKERLLEQIKSKKIKPGEYLPSEEELKKKYNISRTPIRKALSELEQDGYVKKKMGKGTLVISGEKVIQKLPSFSGFAEDMKDKGLRAGYKLVQIIIDSPPSHILNYLGEKSIHNNNLNYKIPIIDRLMYANEETMALHKVFLFDKKCLEFADKLKTMLAEGASLYKSLNSFDIHASSAEQYIGASVATKKQAELLNITTGEPLIVMERITYGTNDNLIEYVKGFYRADRYRYSIRMERKQ